MSRPITEHLKALTKFAYYDGDDAELGGRPDRWRFWLELTFKY